MATLVTGATGFIGNHLARRLLARGETVRVLARNPDKARALRELGAEVFKGDLLDPATLVQPLAGSVRVYHVAAQMLAEGISRNGYERSNVEATQNLVDAALAAGSVRRFVHTSSAGVYGKLTAPVDEDGKVSPSSAYRQSKARAEDVCQNAIKSRGLPAVIARISPVIGAGSNNYLGLARGIASGSFRLIGDGRNYDHITPVEDLVEGLILCGETPAINARTYILAGDTRATTRDIVDWFAEALEVSPPAPGGLPRWPYAAYTQLCESAFHLTGRDLPFHYRYAFFLANKTLINARAKRELGFAPTVDLKDAIRQAVVQYRSEGLV
ncbi:MAG: NAD-dependent epimerase/dehydratase family protein [Sphingomonadaceae bacterium]